MPYCTRQDIENIFGRSNVEQWADVNNNSATPEIASRIEWAINLAGSELDARMRGGVYAVPFTDEPFDTLWVNAVARLAGVLLYEGRGITDVDTFGRPVHPLSTHRDMAYEFVRKVRGGAIRLSNAHAFAMYPQNINNCSERGDDTSFVVD